MRERLEPLLLGNELSQYQAVSASAMEAILAMGILRSHLQQDFGRLHFIFGWLIDFTLKRVIYLFEACTKKKLQ
ncbi:hypothetical protein OPV22_030474 [Ensete ventricosum]|uniref:Uncharacterized protein n=1 Tax=Ensete ventricosum TaxID=4639 RepID=A0AAV8P8D4_ENSVE|nr:hypothetical protein OPV22_030474 [Ensete ventricosum]